MEGEEVLEMDVAIKSRNKSRIPLIGTARTKEETREREIPYRSQTFFPQLILSSATLLLERKSTNSYSDLFSIPNFCPRINEQIQFGSCGLNPLIQRFNYQ